MELRTRYLGLDLRSPLVASSSPLTGDLRELRKIEDAGAGAVVLPSLFAEQMDDEGPPILDFYNSGRDLYLGLIADAKARLSIPVIASLNAASRGGWVRHAALLEQAGADAIELNIYYVASDPTVSGAEVEHRYLEIVAAVRDAVSIPLAVKVGPYFSAMAHMAREIVAVGADGLVLFNRFYQPDIDLTTRDVTPHLTLSTSEDLRLTLRWIAILHGRVESSLAATGGIHTAEDAAKALLAGADVTMLASALLRHGPEHLAQVEAALVDWMVSNGYESVSELRGHLSHGKVEDPVAYERANYLNVLVSGAARFRPRTPFEGDLRPVSGSQRRPSMTGRGVRG